MPFLSYVKWDHVVSEKKLNYVKRKIRKQSVVEIIFLLTVFECVVYFDQGMGAWQAIPLVKIIFYQKKKKKYKKEEKYAKVGLPAFRCYSQTLADTLKLVDPFQCIIKDVFASFTNHFLYSNRKSLKCPTCVPGQ